MERPEERRGGSCECSRNKTAVLYRIIESLALVSQGEVAAEDSIKTEHDGVFYTCISQQPGDPSISRMRLNASEGARKEQVPNDKQGAYIL